MQPPERARERTITSHSVTNTSFAWPSFKFLAKKTNEILILCSNFVLIVLIYVAVGYDVSNKQQSGNFRSNSQFVEYMHGDIFRVPTTNCPACPDNKKLLIKYHSVDWHAANVFAKQ